MRLLTKRVGVLLVYRGPGVVPALLSYPAFYLQSSTFSEWAMLDLNQRPPPCKGGLLTSQTFVVVQNSLQTDVFSLLNRCCCSPSFVWVGVLIGVPNPWRKTDTFVLLFDLQPL